MTTSGPVGSGCAEGVAMDTIAGRRSSRFDLRAHGRYSFFSCLASRPLVRAPSVGTDAGRHSLRCVAPRALDRGRATHPTAGVGQRADRTDTTGLTRTVQRGRPPICRATRGEEARETRGPDAHD